MVLLLTIFQERAAVAEVMFTVSLRIEHPTLRFESIAQTLALKATFGYSVGEPRKTPKGGLLEGDNKKTYCCFDLIPKQAGNFTDGLRHLMPRLDAHTCYFQKLTEDGGRVELFVGIFTEESTGFMLSVHDMAMLAKSALQLSIEVYY